MHSSPAITDIALESKVAFLRQPGSYPGAACVVEAIETHMSWVFLADGYAYKLKKPVHHDFLDFRTVDARKYFCEEELRLNRRLAPDVYLAVVALAVDATGHLQFDAAGTTVDWLVKMRRLPHHRMLDYAIRHGTAVPDDIRRIALRLADFYQHAPPLLQDAARYRARLLDAIAANREALKQPAYQLPPADIERLCDAQQAVVRGRAAWFEERVRLGRIIEGHGDLRPEHVCLEQAIAIIDCLEFSLDLRTVDPADELGFLALECERFGAPQYGTQLMQDYAERTGDRPPAPLVHFYQSYRAGLRAAIAARHLDEEKFRFSAVWRRRAIDYLRLAQRHQDAINSVSDSPP